MTFKISVLALILCAGMLLGAAVSDTAQAAWLVLGSTIDRGSAAISSSTITDKLSKIEGTVVPVVECTGLAVKEGKIYEPDKILIGALEFTGCTGNFGTCKLKSQLDSRALEGLATLNGPLAAKAKLKPETGNVFAILKWEGAEICNTISEQIGGSVSILIPEGGDERLWHLISLYEEEVGELQSERAANISGATLVHLENDMLWSFD